MDELKTKLAKVEKEKKEHEINTSRVIEQLTLLSLQKDDQIQNFASDINALNQTFNDEANGLVDENGKKKKKEKISKKEKRLKIQVESLEKEIIALKKQNRDLNSFNNQRKRNEEKEAKQLQELEYVKRIFILEEFMIRSHSVINKRAIKHMRTLKKVNTLDIKMFDTLMQKQEWSLKLDDNKKQLVDSIKEMEKFLQSFNKYDDSELERMKSKISEDYQTEKEKEDLEEDDDEDDKIIKMSRTASMASPDLRNNLTGTSTDILNTFDLGDDYMTPQSRRIGSPTGSENHEFEEYVKRLD